MISDVFEISILWAPSVRKKDGFVNKVSQKQKNFRKLHFDLSSSGVHQTY